MILYFITGNKHKFQEISAIIKSEAPWINLKMANNIPKTEIQDYSLENIALFAAKTICEKFDKNFILEDAGLFIRSLGGFPGPYSSYVYKTIGCDGILKLLDSVSDRTAEFKSVIVLYYQGILKIFVGLAKGKISIKKRGSLGFGFDPIFIPEGSEKTFAEMTLEEKNLKSHRGKSTRKLLEFLKNVKK